MGNDQGQTTVARTAVEEHAQGRRRPSRRVLIAMLSGMAMLMSMLLPTSAGAVQATNVSGNATPSDCNDGQGEGSIELTGDLEGCLIFYVDSYTCTELNGFALYEETGTETFEGRHHGEEGRFRTTYTLAGTFAEGACALVDAAVNDGGDWPGDKQLTGGCNHRTYGQTGVFAHKVGRIIFHDIIPEPGVSGASNFFYSGYFA